LYHILTSIPDPSIAYCKGLEKLFFSLVVGLSSHKGKKEVQVKRHEYGGLKMENKEICYTCIQIGLGKISFLHIMECAASCQILISMHKFTTGGIEYQSD
jgi:hypothetical protein